MGADVRVAVGLGSNLGDRAANLRFGLDGLRRLLDDIVCSPVYETDPRNLRDQPSFLNACCVGRTRSAPRQLLVEFQHVEGAAGRRRDGPRFGPRALDLDLLLYGDRVIHEEDLIVPHPRLRERGFVLIPLREIAADWRVPARRDLPERCVGELADAVTTEGIEPTDFSLEDP